MQTLKIQLIKLVCTFLILELSFGYNRRRRILMKISVHDKSNLPSLTNLPLIRSDMKTNCQEYKIPKYVELVSDFLTINKRNQRLDWHGNQCQVQGLT